MNIVASAMRTFVALALPYFRSDDRWRGIALAGGVIVLEFLLVWYAVLTNSWNGRFFNALEARNWDSAREELLFFFFILFVAISTGYAQYWLGQHFQLRWRRWMTEDLVGKWMASGRHYRVRFVDDKVDNIHLRIANDTTVFIQKTHELGSGLIGVIITLVTFAIILWGISRTTPMPLFGMDFSFPGYLIVLALFYSAVGTLLAHVIGYRLVGLNFEQQRREADLRFAVARATDRSEQIALTHAEPVERMEIRKRFDALITNWIALVTVNSNLSGFSYGYILVSTVFPTLIVAPAYLAGAIPLGVLVQSTHAFQRVEAGFSFIANGYSRIADWKASMNRLAQLAELLARIDKSGHPNADIVVAPRTQPGIAIRDLLLCLPSGAPITAVSDITLAPGDRLLVSGSSGTGKSVLLRALSGIWRYGSGRVELPADTRVLALQSRPYFPLGTLRQALTVPTPADTVSDGIVRAAMERTGLGSLAGRLDDEDDWPSTLSGGQQQRLGIARALIHRPSLLLLDDAVSNLEQDDIRSLYGILTDELPDTIVIATGRPKTLGALHHVTLDLGSKPKEPSNTTTLAAPSIAS